MHGFIWYFVLYSFLGFLLEVGYARAVRCAKRDRKCFVFLPLCPVYGLGAVAILLLPMTVQSSPPLLLLFGGAAATAVEYLAGLFYEKAMGIKFWDYSALPGSLGGKVCLLFSFLWALLALILVYFIHPAVSLLAERIPDRALMPVLFLMALDGSLTVLLLRRTSDTDSLRWYRGRLLHPNRRQS